MPAARQDPAQSALRAIKAAHTLVWAVFAGCIVALPVFAWRRDFTVAFTLMAVVGLEVLVLLFNGMKCPMTGVAARFTQDRQDNFDIYPLWVARYNKQIFGTLFVAGVVYTLVAWSAN
jgi:membrane-bound metal-dependent hydrolase YbcI (DUF457 family)